MDAALQTMLTDTVTHQRYLAQDGYGSPTFAAPTPLPARVEYKIRRIVTAQGQERLSRARLFLDSTVAVDARDRFVLPDGTAPAIQLLYAVTDQYGVLHHYEVSF